MTGQHQPQPQAALELSQRLPEGVGRDAVLASVTDPVLMERVFQEQDVTVICHAAACNNLALVDANPLAGLANTVISTLVLCAPPM